MRRCEVESLLAYFCNESDRLQSDLNELRQNLRYRPVDQVDCLELALALERLHSFVQFRKSVCAILNLWDCVYDDKQKAGD